MHRQELLKILNKHRTRYLDEAGYIARATRFVQQYPECFERSLLPAHVTGSAWVVSPDRERVLMLHHRKHDRWFQPGGHADGDADILRVALRETSEETGLDPGEIKLVNTSVFDVDIHVIPEMQHFPRHEHIDVRFLVEIDGSLPLPGSDESHDVLWVELQEVLHYNSNRSTWRMLDKTRRMHCRWAA